MSVAEMNEVVVHAIEAHALARERKDVEKQIACLVSVLETGG
jgi:hypothetical protein